MSAFAGIALTTLLFPCTVQAQSSPAITGTPGLLTVPNARMDETGSIRMGASTLGPYLHGYVGLQIAKPLYISLRQSANISSLSGQADGLYPGIDIKLRLMKERKYLPEITLGLQSAIGHKRMAGEYLTLSKRYNDFDFSTGIGWGRLGSAAHLSNPLKAINNHFGRNRDLDGEMPNEMNDWFTGEDVGMFAGLEYFTPFDGVSIKAEWGADRYIAEKTAFDYDPPDPWAIGVSLTPSDLLNFNLAIIGGEKIMGSLNIKSLLKKWPGRSYKNDKTIPLRRHRTESLQPANMKNDAAGEGSILYNIALDEYRVFAKLNAEPHAPIPLQIGHAARHIANHAGKRIEEITITPTIHGIDGPAIRLMRRDLERATNHQGSAEEIWRNAGFNAPSSKTRDKNRPSRPFSFQLFNLVLDNQFSLSEKDSGLLYKSSLIHETRKEFQTKWFHFIYGADIRFELAENLHKLTDIRPRSQTPVRSDADIFAQRGVALERNFLGWIKTIRPDLHLAVVTGYLEEMYGGIGGDLLYRPYGKTYAIGAEAWRLYKRDPYTALNLGLHRKPVTSAHIKGWYEMPNSDLTLHAKAGRYLAEDFGGTLSLRKDMKNGVSVEGFITATNKSDPDLFGGTTHIYSGLQLKLPIGNLPVLSSGSQIRARLAPLGRNSGQYLYNPLDLYDLTTPLSYRQIAQQWSGIVPETKN